MFLNIIGRTTTEFILFYYDMKNLAEEHAESFPTTYNFSRRPKQIYYFPCKNVEFSLVVYFMTIVRAYRSCDDERINKIKNPFHGTRSGMEIEGRCAVCVPV